MGSKSLKTSAALNELRQGREACRRCAWGDAYRSLSLSDQAAPLGTEDLSLLATAAYLTGREDHFCRLLDRAHRSHLDCGDRPQAARCAIWSGMSFLMRGEVGQANAWFARADRIIGGLDCAEQGWRLTPEAELALGDGRLDAAEAAAERAEEIGQRYADVDLVAIARHLLGRVRLRQGNLQAGLALLDETMLEAVGGVLSPIVTGLMYCSLIEACQGVFALSRAREWTAALSQWCDQQKEMVAFQGSCLVRRTEIMRLQGAWLEALAEISRACERTDRPPSSAAFYHKAEMHRLRGEVEEAESAYRSASRSGREPQPGLALLRLSQGRTAAASAAIRRVVEAAADPLELARVLPAHVEIMLATGDIEQARSASGKLEEIAQEFETEVLEAMAAQARGAVALAEGDSRSALVSLRHAFEVWQEIEAPYEAARVRVLIGQTCRSLGDEEAATLEAAAAREVFETLGAVPDLVCLDAPYVARAGANTSVGPRAGAAPPLRERGLTRRELQILRLIASGKTNKSIATELFLSERTIDRHVSNILCKLEVPSRAAATAYAYEHKLLQ